LFPAIAKRLGRCTIAFFKDTSAPWSPLHDKLLDRLSAAFAAHGLRFSDHCVVLPWLDKPTYYGLMQKADIMLDTIGFSGFNTAMQAVECGLPIVTREGRFMRGRLASGILHTMGLSDMIAADEQAYVDLAVALGSDAARRRSYAQRIVELRGRLFEDVQTVHAFGDHLLKLVGR
jgi:predicted O-linked N-acetylglucosamine transferase (SPINDLY family)